MLKNVKKTSFGLHIVGCGLGGVKMDQCVIRVDQSGSEHGLVLPKKENINTKWGILKIKTKKSKQVFIRIESFMLLYCYILLFDILLFYKKQ